MKASVLTVPGRQSVAYEWVVGNRLSIQLQRFDQIEKLRKACRLDAANSQALTHQYGECTGPASADLAQPVGIRHYGVIKENLVEVPAAIHLFDGANFHAALAHVNHKERKTSIFGDGGIGPGQYHTVIRVLGARGPNFLTIENPVVAVRFCAGAQSRHIGAGTRFAE